MVQLSTSVHDYWKDDSFGYIDLWRKVMSLLFNMLSRFIIAFLPRSKCLLIWWLQSPSTTILEPKKIKSATVSIVYPSICHEVMGLDAMILVFWMLSFKPAFSLSPSSRSPLVPLQFLSLKCHHLHIRDWYFSWRSWFQLVSHPAWHFCMVYFAYKLNKQGDNIQHWCAPFPTLNQSVVPSPVLLLLDLHTGFSGDG